MEKILEVKKLMEKGSENQVKQFAYMYVVKTQKQFGYTQDQIGQMSNVLKAETLIDEIQVEMNKGTMKMVELLTEVDKDWEVKVQAAGGIIQYLKAEHNVEIHLITMEEQKEITKEITGKSMTIEDIMEGIQ